MISGDASAPNGIPSQSGFPSNESSARQRPEAEIRRSSREGDFHFQIRVGETTLRFHSTEPDFAGASLQIMNPAHEAAGDILDGLSLFLERMRRNGVEEISLNGRPLTVRGLA